MAIFRPYVVAIGAGLASALLLAASARSAGAGLVLAYLTPLPIMIAALGFGHATGLVAAAVAACALAFDMGLLPALFFGLLFGFPGWWLPYLSLLARPLVVEGGPTVPTGATLNLWYPIGRLIAWGAGLVAAAVLATGGLIMLRFGGFENAVSSLASRLDQIIGQVSADQLSATATARHVVQVLPVLTGASAFLLLMINLWLAARIVQRSGLLARPWPPLPENIRLPKPAVAILLLGLVAVVPGGAVRVAGGVVAASFGMAFALQGLAAAHALTRGLAARRLILLAIYVITFSVVPSLVALAVLGVVDCLLPMRQRVQSSTPPLTRS